MISIDNISKSYKKIKALDNVSVDLHAGQSVAVIGPNGSGKSTFMKCILGLVFTDTGKIKVFGEEISGSVKYREHIGYMPQIIHFPANMKVSQLFKMIRDIRSVNNTIDDQLIREFEIGVFIDKPLGSLSGGMKQKVNAAIAFMFDPKILILDEPTAGLDPLSAEILKEKIRVEKSKGKLIIISSHIMADLEEITSDVFYLIDGKIEIFSPLEELIRQTQTTNLSKAIAKIMSGINHHHENH